MSTQSQKSSFITGVRNSATGLLQSIEALKGSLQQWNAIISTDLADEDFIGTNEGLTKAEISAVVGTTLTAIDTLLDTGHYTNLYRVIK